MFVQIQTNHCHPAQQFLPWRCLVAAAGTRWHFLRGYFYLSNTLPDILVPAGCWASKAVKNRIQENKRKINSFVKQGFMIK